MEYPLEYAPDGVFTLPNTDTDKKMGCKELCGGVHTGRHRHSHRHRFKWVANPFCPCLCQCRPVLTLHELWSTSFSMNCATGRGGRHTGKGQVFTFACMGWRIIVQVRMFH